MSIDHPENELLGILAELRKLPCETEWAEFKLNNAEPDEIGIDEKNSSMVSRIIKDAIEAGLIRCHDETVGSRARKYLPRWA